MTTAEYFGLARPRTNRLSGAGLFVLATLSTIRRWARMQRAIHELRQLDDRMLADIGLNRSSLYAAAREVHGFGNRGYGRY